MTNLTSRILVPAQNSADNVLIQDVVGNKTDTDAGNSIYALIHILSEHIHSAAKVYPTLAAAVVVSADSTAWTLGSFVEIVPASTITSPFDIHHVNVDAVSAVDSYELVLYSGAVSSEVEIARVRFSKTTNVASANSVPIQTVVLPANTRISAKTASKEGTNNASISLSYHTY